MKALHHYDRLGLLKPVRTDAGYRVYSERDLETLEQIVALKFFGVPLKEIAAVLRRPSLKLRDTLRLQRGALEERRELLGRAIRAIQAAEEALDSGQPADLAMLKNIIGVIEMQDTAAAMKKYYSEESWEQHRRYYEEGPSAEWQEFYRDAQSLLGEDPASAEAQALVGRWFELSRRAHEGDPAVATDSAAAWMDRANWPEAMKQRAAEFRMEEVDAFVKQAALDSRRWAFSERAWAKVMELRKQSKEENTARWRERVELFREIEAALGEDPAGERAQALAARWRARLEAAMGGDAELLAKMRAGWAHRRQWPEENRWMVEYLNMMSFERFERCADFLDRALAAGEAR